MPNAITIRRYAAYPMPFFEDAFKARGLVMTDFQRERFAILAEIAIALAHGIKPRLYQAWLEAVKGASKDCDVALFLIWLVCFAKVPLDVQVGAGDEDQSTEMLKAAKAWIKAIDWLESRTRILNSKLICKNTDCIVTFIASDATGGAHGSRCQLYVINEITHIQKVEFWQTLLDNAVKVDGCVLILTNAGWIGSEAWKLREFCRTSDRCGFHQFGGPVPWQDAEKLEARRRTSTLSHYLRLYEGVWSSGLGDALEECDLLAAIDESLTPLTTRIPRVTFCGGLDLGIKSDHSALVVIGKHQPHGGEPHYRLAMLKTWAPVSGGKVDLSDVEAEVLRAKEAFGLSVVAFDPWQCAFMAERLEKAGLRMQEVPFTGKHLDILARNLLEVFRNRVFSMPPTPRLLADLRRLSIVEKSYGFRLSATRDETGHADSATALTLALLAARDCEASVGSWGGTINSGSLERSYLNNKPAGTREKPPLGGYSRPGPDWSRVQ